jgi:hypothetical protein
LPWKRYLSPPFFLIALLCFFLPFFAVTCSGGGLGGLGGGGGDSLTEVSGFQLITGQAEDQVAEDLQDVASGGGGIPGLGDLPIPGPSPSVPAIPGVPSASSGGPDLGTPQIWAIAAAAVALLGIFLSLLAGRVGGLMALILGAAGAALLFLLASSFKSAFFEGSDAKQAEAIIDIENKIGYLLALGAFVVAALTGLIRLLLPDRAAAPPGEADAAGFGQPPTAPPPPPETPPQ